MSDAPPPAHQPQQPAVARDVRTPLIAAVIVAGYLVAQSLIGLFGYVPGFQGIDGTFSMARYVLTDAILPHIAFAGGVFVLLLLWPVTQKDSVMVQLAKAAVATVAGAVVSSIVVFMMLAVTAGIWSLADWRYLDAPYIFGGVLGTVIARAPLVMLVVVLQQLVRKGLFRA